ncbi:MAG TPA: hypothetical protein VJ962_00235 [Clostridia bacterium]|nr:hypothetical protein [Clostridia bacterium]
MNKKLIVSLMLFIILFSNIVFSNSAEPPSLIIVVPSSADGIEISIVGEPDGISDNKISKVFETYHQFYLYDLSKRDTLTVHVNTESKSFNITIDEPLNQYRNTYTLNLEKQILEEGYNRPLLNLFLILVRILLTLLIEGFVFYVLGFRWKQSWHIFLIINLITQGALNIWLSTFNLSTGYSVFLALVLSEILILIVETITFFMGINEKHKLILLIHVVTANVLSFIAGGYLITWLPL